jgi:hypothetical protein
LSDTTARITGVATGTDTVYYTVVNTCGSGTVAKVVSVQVFPSAGSISGPATVCQGASISVSDSVSGGVWSVNNTDVTLTSLSVNAILTGITGGTDTLRYTMTNSCGSASATSVITVDPLPYVGPISGTSGLCTGFSSTFTDSISGGLWGTSNTNAYVT